MGNVQEDIRRLEQELTSMGVDVSSYGQGAPSVTFGECLPLPRPMPPAPWPMPPECMSDAIYLYAAEVARSFNVPVEYAVVPALVCAATMIGGRFRVRGGDRWFPPCTLWGAIFGNPGMRKGAAAKMMFRPLRFKEDVFREEYAREKERADQARFIWNATKERLEHESKAASSERLEEIAAELSSGQPQDPHLRRKSTSNSTPEKIAIVLSENPDGIAWILDELTALFSQMAKKGREDLTQLLLSSWEGTEALSIDRVSRESVYVPEPLLWLFGGIQPEVWRDILSSRLPDGLLPRFQIPVWPEIPPYVEDLTPISDAAESTYFRNVLHLADLDPAELGAKPHEDGFYFLDMSPEAFALFRSWQRYLARAVRLPDVQLRSDLCSVLSKSSSLPLKLALVDHLVGGGHGDIPADCMARAIELSLVFFSHGVKAFAIDAADVTPPEIRLAELIQSGSVRSPFTVSSIKERDLRGLDGSAVNEAVSTLQAAGWVVAENVRGNGRPTIRYHVNPNLPINPFSGFSGGVWTMFLQKVFTEEFNSHIDAFSGFSKYLYKSKISNSLYYINRGNRPFSEDILSEVNPRNPRNPNNPGKGEV